MHTCRYSQPWFGRLTNQRRGCWTVRQAHRPLAGSIARDAVSGADKPPELLDVEMNHVAGVIMDITPRGFSGFEVFESRQAGPFQYSAAVAEPAEATVAGDTLTIWAICLPVSR